MHSNHGERFELRVRALERRLARQRALNLLLGGCLALAGLTALRAPRAEVLQAKRFEVVNDAGTVCGTFGIGGRLGVSMLGLEFDNPLNGAAAMLTVGDVLETGEAPATAMLYLEQGEGVAHLYAADEHTSLAMYQSEDRSAVLHIGKDHSDFVLEEPTGDDAQPSREVLHLDSAGGAAHIRGWNAAGEASVSLP